ncbi:hypothetical protein DFLDMN_000463 [Cupriavidus sp. H19C3]
MRRGLTFIDKDWQGAGGAGIPDGRVVRVIGLIGRAPGTKNTAV